MLRRVLNPRSGLLALATLALTAGLLPPASAGGAARTSIDHVLVIVQENHSFDSYFAPYCQATKSCNLDSATRNPYAPLVPIPLTDATTLANDPNHEQVCELAEIDHGKMDGYVTPNPAASLASGYPCGSPANFAQAPNGSGPIAAYQRLATGGGLADNYFQPIAGASSSNDMYLWSAHFEFTDNTVEPDAVGKQCSTNSNVRQYDDGTHPNLGAVLDGAGVSWAWYAEGYDAMKNAGSGCPTPPPGCGAHVPSYPCVFDPSDLPPEYYKSSADNAAHIHDYAQLLSDIGTRQLPSVAYVKAIGYRTEHPGYGTTLTDGVDFVQRTIAAVQRDTELAAHTLILVTWDESGGYADHVAPPRPIENYPGTTPPSPVPYGPRVPLLALGAGVRPGVVSHVQLEHSSIPAFIEWNWLGHTGQLGGRDLVVHNLGSLLDPALGVPR